MALCVSPNYQSAADSQKQDSASRAESCKCVDCVAFSLGQRGGGTFTHPTHAIVYPLRSWLHAVWSWWCQRLLNVHWLASVVKYSRKGRSTKNTSKVNNAHMRERKSGVRWLLYASNCASAGGSQDNTMDINTDANEYLHSVLVLINNTV